MKGARGQGGERELVGSRSGADRDVPYEAASLHEITPSLLAT